MTKRRAENKARHDSKVKQIAKRLKNEGWQVKADIPGYEKPDPIGKKKRIPDITAKKGGAKKIIEVETPETMKMDEKQQETFRRSAAQQKRTSFQIEET